MFHRITVNVLYNSIQAPESISPSPASSPGSSHLLSQVNSSHFSKSSNLQTLTSGLTDSGSLSRLFRLYPPPKLWWNFIHSLLRFARDSMLSESLYRLAVIEIHRVCELTSDMHNVLYCLFVNDLKWDSTTCRDIFSDSRMEVKSENIIQGSITKIVKVPKKVEVDSVLKVKADEPEIKEINTTIKVVENKQSEEMNIVEVSRRVMEENISVSGKKQSRATIGETSNGPLLPMPSVWRGSGVKVVKFIFSFIFDL
jgi:hypothetical protein